MSGDSNLLPVEIYKQIIDGLVQRSPSTGARLISEQSIYSKAPELHNLNDLVKSLTSEQRVILSKILTHERKSAIHDTLALLTWWIDCRDVGLTYRGEKMPAQLSGQGLHGDYVARLDNWVWPDEKKDG